MDRPNWEREGRDWPHRDASRFVTAGGLHWHVQVIGKGPVLLLLHGTGAATHSWRDIVPSLAAYFTVVAPDLPGHGFTSGLLPGGPRLPNVAGAMQALLAALDLSPVAIAGHSAGSAIAVEMTRDQAIPIVMLAPALTPFPGLAARLFPLMAKAIFLNPLTPHILARIARSPGEVARFLSRATGSQIDARGVELYARLFGRAGHIHGTLAMMASWDLDAMAGLLRQLAAPVLVLHGSADSAVPLAGAKGAAALIPKARFETLEGLGHLAHEEEPERIAESIIKELAECNISA